MKPEILTHPNIPKPLHGIAPRTIMGEDWWNKTRQEAYASTDYHCVACGVHKTDARVHQWLEAHEYWTINYKKGVCEVKSIEPLCHYCHNFIHSGRLAKIINNEKTKKEIVEILEHGFKVLNNNNLKCFPGTLSLANRLGVETYGVEAYKIPKSNIKWSEWKLIFLGKEYYSKFRDLDDWKNFYSRKLNN